MNKSIKRALLYGIGILILAFGIILNTKCVLGTSAIVSIAYASSAIFHATIGDMTLIEYVVFIIIEIGIHISNKKEKKVLLMDVLQFPFALVFSRFMNFFAVMIPSFENLPLVIRMIIMLVAIASTALGACMMLAMRIVPNPGDGVVATIAEAVNKELGLVKNFFDISCFCVTIVFCLITRNPIEGIGIGTLMCMIGIGRFISLFNKLFKDRMIQFAEL